MMGRSTAGHMNGAIAAPGLVLAVFFLSSTPAIAEEALTSTAQVDFDKGLASVKQGEWDLAIKYFSQVTDSDPFYSPAYFNLALAHQKKGHDLPALAWFYAYLQNVPDAAEAGAIQKNIVDLEVSIEAKIEKILKQAADLAAALPETTSDYNQPRPRAMQGVFIGYARAGLSDEAMKLVAEYNLKDSSSLFTSDYAKQLAGTALADSGNVDGAFALAQGLSSKGKTEVLASIVGQYYVSWDPAKTDLDKALSYIRQMPDLSEWNSLSDFIVSLAKTGRTDEAIALFEKTAKPSEKFKAGVHLVGALAKQSKTNEIAIMMASLDALYKELEKTDTDKFRRAERLSFMCRALVSAGKKGEATRLAASPLINELAPWQKADIYLAIGDMPKAELCASQITDKMLQEGFQQNVFDALFDAGRVADAGAYLKNVPSQHLIPYSYPVSFAKVAWESLKNHDRKTFDAVTAQLSLQDPAHVTGPYSYPDAYYAQICGLAYENAHPELFEEFYGKIEGEYFKTGALLAAGIQLRKEDKLDESESMFFRDPALWATDQNGSSVFGLGDILSAGMDLARARIKNGQKAQAAELLDRLVLIAAKKKRFDTYKDLAALYKKAAQPEKAEELNHKVLDTTWSGLAKELAGRTDTMDPEGYLKKIQSEPADQIPGKTADLAVAYAGALRKVAHLKSLLTKTTD